MTWTRYDSRFPVSIKQEAPSIKQEVPSYEAAQTQQWPVLKQLQKGDPHAFGETAPSDRTRGLTARTQTADKVVRSVCPYCAVGCGRLIYVKNGRIIDIEGGS